MDIFNQDCSRCPERMICHCLQVTEEALLTTIRTFELKTIKEIGQHTGAGEGCTACHKKLQVYLKKAAQFSDSPVICSVK